MTEADRVRLYNDLCDYKDELTEIHYPPQTRKIDILSRAIACVRGTTAHWEPTASTTQEIANGRLIALVGVKCSMCRFALGRSDFKYCPNCASRMKK